MAIYENKCVKRGHNPRFSLSPLEHSKFRGLGGSKILKTLGDFLGDEDRLNFEVWCTLQIKG